MSTIVKIYHGFYVFCAEAVASSCLSFSIATVLKSFSRQKTRGIPYRNVNPMRDLNCLSSY